MDDTFRFRFRQSHRFIAAAERIPNLKYWSAGLYKNFWNYPKCVPAMATSRWLSISLMALKLVYLNKTKSIFTSKKPLSECCVFLKRRLHGRLRVLELGHRAVRVKCGPVNKTLVSGFISLREMIKLSSILSLKCHQHDIGGRRWQPRSRPPLCIDVNISASVGFPRFSRDPWRMIGIVKSPKRLLFPSFLIFLFLKQLIYRIQTT